MFGALCYEKKMVAKNKKVLKLESIYYNYYFLLLLLDFIGLTKKPYLDGNGDNEKNMNKWWSVNGLFIDVDMVDVCHQI